MLEGQEYFVKAKELQGWEVGSWQLAVSVTGESAV
jgi:hypothetical protein